MIEVYLLLGSNEGDRERNLQNALHLIDTRCGNIAARSGLYETEAWGLKDQNSFLNLAVMIGATDTPTELLQKLKAIEKETGRIDTVKWGPRVIDIDILFYDNQIIDLPELKVPHPYIQDRRFTLIPLKQIAPGLVHPVLQKTIQQLLVECKDASEVRVYRSDVDGEHHT